MSDTPGPITKSPRGHTGMSVHAEQKLLTLAASSGLIPYDTFAVATHTRNTSAYRADLRAAALTHEVLWHLATFTDAQLLSEPGFGKTSLAEFRERFPRDQARPMVKKTPERPDDV